MRPRFGAIRCRLQLARLEKPNANIFRSLVSDRSAERPGESMPRVNLPRAVVAKDPPRLLQN